MDGGEEVTRFGRRPVLRCEHPPPKFWDLWRMSKDALKGMGVRVEPMEGGGFCAVWVGGILMDRPKIVAPPLDNSLVIPADVRPKLLPWQPEPVVRLAMSLRRFGGAMDASLTGTGKTSADLAAVRTAGYRRVVPIVPVSVVAHWEAWGERLGLTTWAVNYEKAVRGIDGLLEWTGKTGKKPVWKPGDYVIIFDEAHRIGGMSTKNSRMAKAAKRQGIPVIAATATLGDSPLKLGAVGEILGLFGAREFYPWLLRNDCAVGKYGMQFYGGDDVMERIRDAILRDGKAVRLNPEDIPGFPESQVDVLLMNTGEEGRIESNYAELGDVLRLCSRSARDNQANRGKVHELCRRIEMLKLPTAVDLLQDAVASGNAGLLFVHYRDTAKAAAEMLGWPLIIGDEENRKIRQSIVADLAADEIPGVVCTDAGNESISLHDVTGRHPRYSVIFPSGASRSARQAMGRTRRAGGRSKSIIRFALANGTREMETARRLVAKLNNLDALTDADYTPFGAVDSSALAEIVG